MNQTPAIRTGGKLEVAKEAYTASRKLIKIALIIVIIVIVFKVARSVSRSFGNQSEQSILMAGGMKPSYQSNIYQTFADNLYRYMKGLGTDENGVFRVFNFLHNDLDFLRLDAAFGVRDGYSMREWIRGDLSSADITTLNNRLRVKGITKKV